MKNNEQDGISLNDELIRKVSGRPHIRTDSLLYMTLDHAVREAKAQEAARISAAIFADLHDAQVDVDELEYDEVGPAAERAYYRDEDAWFLLLSVDKIKAMRKKYLNEEERNEAHA